VSRQLEFWRGALAGLPTELDLPTIGRDLPSVPSAAASWWVDLSAELHARLAELARSTGTTLSMIAQAALAAVLTRLGAGTDIPLGCRWPDYRRSARRHGRFFVNTVCCGWIPRVIRVSGVV